MTGPRGASSRVQRGCVENELRAARAQFARTPSKLPCLSSKYAAPFGPIPFDVVFPGARASLWLFPSLAYGLGVALDAGIRAARGRRGPASAAVAVAAVATAVYAAPDPVAYGALGTRSATAFVEEQRTPGAVVLFFEGPVHMVASEPPVRFRVTADEVSDPGNLSMRLEGLPRRYLALFGLSSLPYPAIRPRSC